MANGNNELMPGSTDPAMSYRFADPDEQGSSVSQPSARYVSPKDVAATALWNLGGRVASSFYQDVVKPIGQVYTGELTPSMEPGPNLLSVPEYASNLALNALGAKGLGFSAPPGSLGMIVGERAAAQIPGDSSKLTALDDAEYMHSTGKYDRDAIFDATGWFLDEDKNWKFIMSDEGAKFNTDKLDTHYSDFDPRTGAPIMRYNIGLKADPAQDVYLPDILQHDELYKAYPWLRDVRIKPMPPEMANVNDAGIGADWNSILLSPLEEGDMFQSVAHETQHLIQKYEDFARGGASKEFLPPDHNANMEIANTTKDDIELQMQRAGYNPEEVAKKLGLYPNVIPEPYNPLDLSRLHPDLLSRYRSVTENLGDLHNQRVAAWRQYLKLGGEVEARSTQAMLHAQVWNQPPWRVGTYDKMRKINVPYPEQGTQIILHHGQRYNATPMPEDFDPFDVTRTGGQ